MFEPVPPPTDDLCDSSTTAAAAPRLEVDPSKAPSDSTVAALDSVDLRTALEMIGEALTADANETTRAGARELWSRLSQLITAAPALSSVSSAPAQHAAPTALSSPVPAVPSSAPALPQMQLPAVPAPTIPFAHAARMLRQLPPEQLLDVVLHRLRAALPAGAVLSTPKAIQFQLVPVSPPLAPR